jgi:hypothetical protein
VPHTVNVANIAIVLHAFMVPPILNETRRSPWAVSAPIEGFR